MQLCIPGMFRCPFARRPSLGDRLPSPIELSSPRIGLSQPAKHVRLSFSPEAWHSSKGLFRDRKPQGWHAAPEKRHAFEERESCQKAPEKSVFAEESRRCIDVMLQRDGVAPKICEHDPG